MRRDGRGHPLCPPRHRPSLGARPRRLLTPSPLSVPLVPTRRTVSRAPPPSHYPAGGWAPPCILEEPAGLCPPAPGLHRSHSGEQAPWTGSGERPPMDGTIPSSGGGGAPGAPRGSRCICVSLPAPLAPCLVSGEGKASVWLSSLCRVVWLVPALLLGAARLQSKSLPLPGRALR